MNVELKKIAEKACQRARAKGAKEVGAAVRSKRNYKVVVRDGKLEEIKSAESRGLTIRVFVDGRYGSHSTSELTPAALDRFVDDAVEMTRFLMPDKHRALPEPRYYEKRSTADLEIHDAAQAKVTMAERKRLAMEAHDAAREAGGDKVISVGAGYSDSVTERVLVQTNGFADGERSTSFSVWADVSVNDAKLGKRPSDWDQAGARHRAKLASAADVGRRAARRALGQIGADKIKTCTLPVVIENRCVGRVLGGLLSPLGGQALDQKRSCFEGKEGQVVAARLLSIIDDPLLPSGWGSRRYDGEGITARRMPVIEEGVLRAFYVDTYYGRKLGRPPTTAGSSNLLFGAGKGDVDALCKAAGKAILITHFIGGNSNSTTGDFSHGIGGFLIEGGERSRPIASMNLSGSHLEFWKQLRRLGDDPYTESSQRTPSLLFKPLLVAGK
jgi:PmbA protein